MALFLDRLEDQIKANMTANPEATSLNYNPQYKLGGETVTVDYTHNGKSYKLNRIQCAGYDSGVYYDSTLIFDDSEHVSHIDCSEKHERPVEQHADRTIHVDLSEPISARALFSDAWQQGQLSRFDNPSDLDYIVQEYATIELEKQRLAAMNRVDKASAYLGVDDSLEQDDSYEY